MINRIPNTAKRTAIKANDHKGKPLKNPIPKVAPADRRSARGSLTNWLEISLPRLVSLSLDTRVVTIPAVKEINREGFEKLTRHRS